MPLQVIPIRAMVRCPEKSEISDADLVETKECYECKYRRYMYANQVHCMYPEAAHD